MSNRGARHFAAVVIFFYGAVGAISGCAHTNRPPAADVSKSLPAKLEAPIFAYLGDFHRPITTQVPLAQRYFDQGLALTYGFDYAEAARSFRAATIADPTCAICFWGLGLVLGSMNNTILSGHEQADAFAAATSAQQAGGAATDVERGLIHALTLRYSKNTPTTSANEEPSCHQSSGVPKEARETYAAAMRALLDKYPQDADVASIYAGSIFDLVDWEFWTADRKPKAHTLELGTALQTALRANKNHIGLNHYYIHLMERSDHPEVGVPSAQRLSFLSPGLEHIVHMPSHVSATLGEYDAAVLTNERAARVFRGYKKECELQGFTPVVNFLEQHNLHFLSWAAGMGGQSVRALNSARDVVALTLPLVDQELTAQGFLTLPYFAHLRFEQWDELLNEAGPKSEWPYANAMWHYARGVAHANLSQTADAEREHATLLQIASEAKDGVSGVSGRDLKLMAIARATLEAALARAKGDSALEISLLKQATELGSV